MEKRNNYRTLDFYMNPKSDTDKKPFKVFIEIGVYSDNRPAILLMLENGIEFITEITCDNPSSFANADHRYISVNDELKESNLDFLDRYGLIAENDENAVSIKDPNGSYVYDGVFLNVGRLAELLKDMPFYMGNIETLKQCSLIK